MFSLANYSGKQLSYKLSDSSGANATISGDDKVIPANMFPLNFWTDIDTTGYDTITLTGKGFSKKKIDLTSVHFSSGNFWGTVGVYDAKQPRFFGADGAYLSQEAMNASRILVDKNPYTAAYLMESKSKIQSYIMWILIFIIVITLAVVAYPLAMAAYHLKNKKQ
jgi:hypothetical protein